MSSGPTDDVMISTVFLRDSTSLITGSTIVADSKRSDRAHTGSPAPDIESFNLVSDDRGSVPKTVRRAFHNLWRAQRRRKTLQLPQL
jgi:hypothetical protein